MGFEGLSELRIYVSYPQETTIRGVPFSNTPRVGSISCNYSRAQVQEPRPEVDVLSPALGITDAESEEEGAIFHTIILGGINADEMILLSGSGPRESSAVPAESPRLARKTAQRSSRRNAPGADLETPLARSFKPTLLKKTE